MKNSRQSDYVNLLNFICLLFFLCS